MKFLIIPRITDKSETLSKCAKIDRNVTKTMPTMSVGNLAAYSFLTKEPKGEETSISLLSRGYFALSQMETFKVYDIYIGYLLKENFETIDYIIYEDSAAKEIAEMRGFDKFLPRAREVIVCSGIDEVANAVYERAVIRNFGTRK